MEEATKVAVVILNWNGKKLLEEFLPSVIDTIPSYAKIYVADNCSTDDSLEFVFKNYPKVKVVKNNSNYGFAKGYNEALTEIKEPYLVLLNSDVACAPNWIEPIYEFMEVNPKVGICQPKILDYKNKTKFEYAGASGGFIDKFSYPFCRGRIFNELENDKKQYDSNTQIFWATGACMFIRNNLFKELNGFDESFFAHMEEIDLCWRAQNTGATVFCIPASTVFHLGGGTLKKLNPKKTYLNFRNNLLMILKNDTAPYFIGRLFLKLILDGIAGIKFLAEGSPLHTWSVVKAHFYVYLNARKYLIERKKLGKVATLNSLPSIYSGSIVADYYLRGKKTFKDLKF